MGKKKNKKVQEVIENQGSGDDVAGAQIEKNVKKGGKKKKPRDNWEDEVFNEIEALKLNDNGGQSNEQSTKEVLGETKSTNDTITTNNCENESCEKVSSQVKNSNQPTEEAKEIEKPEANKKKKKKKAKKVEEATPEAGVKVEGESAPLSNRAKKKAEKEKKKEEKEKPKRKINKATLALMKETLRRQKEEEERLQKEEEERIRLENEAEEKRLADLERERLKKEKKKQQKKDRIKRQKQEGTYLTPAQKEVARRNKIYLETLRQQGIVPDPSAPASRKPRYENKKKKQVQASTKNTEEVVEKEETVLENEEVEDWENVAVEEEDEEDEESGDDWEALAEEKTEEAPKVEQVEKSVVKVEEEKVKKSSREVALDRISKRKSKNEKERSVNNLRAPVICVMGHVDTGKTKILDKLRHTNVQDGEAGGITQQIGATNVPITAVQEQTQMVLNFSVNDMKIPGLLLIDTPGHESFSNLRSRGSSNCDMAVLVVDIMHGLEPQTIESIKMLKKKKVPFIVALNKIDRLYKWEASANTDISEQMNKQASFVQDEFRRRVNDIIVEFAKQNLNVKLFYENDDPDTWISMVPTSAHSGDGMGNLMALVVQNCQNMLAKRLSFSNEIQCTVLEVKDTQGLGTTVDVLLVNGSLKYGDTIVLAGHDGPIVTNVKSLLMPEPMKEFRVKNSYATYQKVKGAQGVRICAKELDKALAGTSLLVADHDDEVEILKEEAEQEVAAALGNIKVSDRGVFVQASTLGSLEALLEFLKTSEIPYAGINIGPVHKKDVMKTSVMLERDEQWAVILAFDVKIEREAQDFADSVGVRIFSADIIYHLFDAFMNHREEMKKDKQEEFRDKAIFPCHLSIVPDCVFKSRDPIVVGVKIEAGQLRLGTPLCVLSKGFVSIGKVTSIESNHKPVESAGKSEEVCIKIEGPPGEPPKMIGRHFEISDEIYSTISRDSIDILKKYFREEMTRSDWQLIIQLKKKMEII